MVELQLISSCTIFFFFFLSTAKSKLVSFFSFPWQTRQIHPLQHTIISSSHHLTSLENRPNLQLSTNPYNQGEILIGLSCQVILPILLIGFFPQPVFILNMLMRGCLFTFKAFFFRITKTSKAEKESINSQSLTYRLLKLNSMP